MRTVSMKKLYFTLLPVLFLLCLLFLPKTARAVVQVDNWESLRTAVEDGNEDTIELTADFSTTSSGPISVTRDVTITSAQESGPHTITRAETGHTNSFFETQRCLLTLNNITLDGNKENVVATYAILRIGGSLTLERDATVQNNNVASNQEGAAIALESNGTLTMKAGSSIAGCESTHTAGGIFSAYRGTFNMEGGRISDCKTSGMGGGVAFFDGTFNMTGGSIENCEAGQGGGVCLGYGATGEMSGGNISGCRASSNGGGMLIIDADFTLSGTAMVGGKGVKGNSSFSGGGIVFVTMYDNHHTFAMTGGTVQGNDAGNFTGGGISVGGAGALLHMSGGTITGNSCFGNGKGIYSSNSIILSGMAKIGTSDTDNEVFLSPDNKIILGGTDGLSTGARVNAAVHGPIIATRAKEAGGAGGAATDAEAAYFYYPGYVVLPDGSDYVIVANGALTVHKDGEAYADHGKTFTLRQNKEEKYIGVGTGGEVVFGPVEDGIYSIYDGEENTGLSLNTAYFPIVTLNYYTVEFSATPVEPATGGEIAATYHNEEIESGAVVLGGETLTLTASGSGAESERYNYQWSGIGASSAEDTEGAVLSIRMLTTTIDVDCEITGLEEGTVPTPESSSSSSSSSGCQMQTLVDPKTGVTATGCMMNGTRLVVRAHGLHTESEGCPACAEIQQRIDAGEVIAQFDISLVGGYRGDIIVDIPVNNEYNGQRVTILHCNQKSLETVPTTVENSMASGAFRWLSPFAVVQTLDLQKEVPTPPKTGDANESWIGVSLLAGGALLLVVVVWKRRKRHA